MSASLDLERLKKVARRHKKRTGCTHSQALDEVARQIGYPRWSLLHRAYSRGLRPGRERRAKEE